LKRGHDPQHAVLARHLHGAAQPAHGSVQLRRIRSGLALQPAFDGGEEVTRLGSEIVVQRGHLSWSPCSAARRGSSTRSFSSRTARSSPTNTARLITLCPRFSSSISPMAATSATFSYVRP